MTSPLTLRQNFILEWNVYELPKNEIYIKSPVFIVRDRKLHFQFVRSGTFCLQPRLEDRISLRSAMDVEVRVELKNNACSYLLYGPVTLNLGKMQYIEFLPSVVESKIQEDRHFQSGLTLRFLFFFKCADKPMLPGYEDQTSEKSTQADVGLVQPDLEFLSIDFGSLLDDEVHPDIRIRCKGGVVQAHRAVLSARSRVFATMFRTDMREKETGVVDMQHMDLETLRLLLKFIYCGKIPEFQVEMASALYPLGDKYEISALKKMCADFMARNVSEENYTEYLSLADAHGDDSFKEAVIGYVVDNPELLKNDRWLKFSAEHTKLALEVTLKYVNDLPPKK